MSDAAIVIEGLSKTYQRGKVRRGDLRTSLSSWWSGLGKEKEEFYALNDINLTIAQGDVVGIIGPNGAGKSTLLKLLSRITFPTKGRMTIHGTLSSMLEVGTGFHPELTGRENIYLNGAIIGMRRDEVSRKLDSIVSFSGLEAFLDTPVKHYSSGMYVRLAFSVASHLEPDILLIDEVLAVGDQEFRKKCMARLLDVSGQGRTIIMVSHQMSYLKDLCHTGVYLHAGSVMYQGTMDDTINHYVNHYSTTKRIAVRDREDRRGSGIVRMTSFEALDKNEYPVHNVAAGEAVTFRMQLATSAANVFNVVIQIEFYDMYGQLCFVANNSISDHAIPKLEGQGTISCHVQKFPLNTGLYFINASIYASNQLSDEILNLMEVEVDPGTFYNTGLLPPAHKGFLAEYSWK
ncbi:MAG: ABC transporter ATP-binding protein [Saprospiraceae bacterium]|nr:ABC transporter ATP-binding protein [Candidatus Opimibacter iunctus]